MIKISQTNSAWAKLFLFPSQLTVGRYGCTTCCICMLSDYFKCYKNPIEAIDKNIKYTKGGLIIWQSINFKNFKFEKRVYGFNKLLIDNSLRHPDKAVILEVNNHSHWVVAIRKVPFTNHYFVVDPWDGKIKTTMNLRNITGSAHFLRKNVN